MTVLKWLSLGSVYTFSSVQLVLFNNNKLENQRYVLEEAWPETQDCLKKKVMIQ